MDCDRLRELLFDHADGLLGREEADAARSHLAECGECRRLQGEVRRNFGALDAWEEEEVPAGAWERLVSRLPSGPRAPVEPGPPTARERRRPWLRVAVPYAAGIATAAAAAWFFLLPGGREAGPAAPAGPAGIAPSPAAAPVADGGPAGLRPGERPLVFRDADSGVIRKLLLPEGVDPSQVELVNRETPPIVAPGSIR